MTVVRVRGTVCIIVVTETDMVLHGRIRLRMLRADLDTLDVTSCRYLMLPASSVSPKREHGLQGVGGRRRLDSGNPQVAQRQLVSLLHQRVSRGLQRTLSGCQLTCTKELHAGRTRNPITSWTISVASCALVSVDTSIWRA